jgi:signal transduction histidine kinase
MTDEALSERLLARFVMEHCRVPLLILDAEGRVVTSNHAAGADERCDLCGLFAGVPQDAAVADFLEQLRATGRATRALPALDDLQPPLVLEGYAIGEHFVVVARDQSARALYDELVQARRMETLGLMTARVAHDLNNLLTPILIMCRELRTDLDGDGSTSLLARDVESAAGRAVNLVGDLVGFARPRLPATEVVSVSAVVSAMRPLMEVILGRTVQLRLTLDERPTNVRIDRGRLEQALLNLVTNAATAMPHGGELRVTTANVTVGQLGETPHHRMAYVVLVVSDSGIGMTDDIRMRAFDDFFTTRSGHGGTGLGLTSVRHFVEESNGLIALTSEPGKGTSVVIHLPLVSRSGLRRSLAPDSKPPSGRPGP